MPTAFQAKELSLLTIMPHVPFVCNPKAYQEHYGGGFPVFEGEIIQEGYGIGNVLGGLFRTLVPLASKHVLPALKRTAKTAGKSLLRSGINVVKDVALEKKNLKDSLKRHAKTSVEDLLDSFAKSQKGSGYRCKLKRLQKKRKVQDIFA